VWRALRSSGVDEWLTTVITVMYADTLTMVKLKCGVRRGLVEGWCTSRFCSQPVVVHHLLKALPRRFTRCLPMELLYADNLVLLTYSEDLLAEKIKMWKTGMEEKGRRVSMGKIKVLR